MEQGRVPRGAVFSGLAPGHAADGGHVWSPSINPRSSTVALTFDICHQFLLVHPKGN